MTVLECTPSLRQEIVTVLRKARLPASFKSMFASSALNRAECLTVELQALAQKKWILWRDPPSAGEIDDHQGTLPVSLKKPPLGPSSGRVAR